MNPSNPLYFTPKFRKRDRTFLHVGKLLVFEKVIFALGVIEIILGFGIFESILDFGACRFSNLNFLLFTVSFDS